VAAVVVGIAVLTPAVAANATPTPVGLGSLSTFAVLAGSTVTNTGPSVVGGDLGLSPGTSVTGFPPGTVNNGTQHVTDAVAAQAEADLTTAYNAAAAESPTSPITADLAGQTLTAGTYNNASSIGLSGALTLNGAGNANSIFVFQAGSTLTTGPGSSVVLENGAQACNVFWQVGSSATLDTTTNFVGTIMAYASISLNNGVTVKGRALASTGAVTLINDTFTVPTCATSTSTTATTQGTSKANAKTASPNGTSTGTGTPNGTGTPSGTLGSGTLPTTGINPLLPIVGGSLVGFGILLVALSNARRRRASA
jgi:type VI secretion system secreted protein VgrG